ncbi:TPA: tail fiber domain-containing protein [Enterobacter asburiae]|uniref:tail fiber domain-containing protein n=3 Tax=Enterobacter cloacae complex TaxID=354276 RepID=UPI003D6F3DB6|nr:tail fiber domain-containing protein [Enterobacter asburiae]HBM7659273.1 tail fiber domain-containing protein [Enterobacter asburiae]HBM7675051.1 tail fiber domain-containing protein [Enterobacter asburiae]
MSAGTITLTNGSAVVGGAGTSFATELAGGDFIVSAVGGVSYTLPVKTVDSNTQLTLVINFTGPTQSGAAWSAVPRIALNMVTAALVAQSAEALRGLNYDKQNWQSIFSGNGNVTVTLPDGTKWTGPAWNSITTILSGKAAKGANDDITSLSGLTTALSLEQGGTGSTTASGARTKLGLGDLATENSSGIRKQLFKVDPQLGSTVELNVFNPGAGVKNGSGLMFRRPASDGYVIMQYNTSGDYEVSNVIMGIDTASRNVSWDFQLSGNAVANAGSWLSNSDKDIKTNIKVIENPLKKMRMMHGYTWERLDDAPPGQGFIAQELMEVMPTAVFEGGRTELKDGTVVEKTLSVDVTGASAALHHEAILALMEQIEDLKKQVEALQPGS